MRLKARGAAYPVARMGLHALRNRSPLLPGATPPRGASASHASTCMSPWGPNARAGKPLRNRSPLLVPQQTHEPMGSKCTKRYATFLRIKLCSSWFMSLCSCAFFFQASSIQTVTSTCLAQFFFGSSVVASDGLYSPLAPALSEQCPLHYTMVDATPRQYPPPILLHYFSNPYQNYVIFRRLATLQFPSVRHALKNIFA